MPQPNFPESIECLIVSVRTLELVWWNDFHEKQTVKYITSIVSVKKFIWASVH